jgi:hypothetical protein
MPLTADQHADLAHSLQRIQTDLEAAHAVLVAAHGKKASRLLQTAGECVRAVQIDFESRAPGVYLPAEGRSATASE